MICAAFWEPSWRCWATGPLFRNFVSQCKRCDAFVDASCCRILVRKPTELSGSLAIATIVADSARVPTKNFAHFIIIFDSRDCLFRRDSWSLLWDERLTCHLSYHPQWSFIESHRIISYRTAAAFVLRKKMNREERHKTYHYQERATLTRSHYRSSSEDSCGSKTFTMFRKHNCFSTSASATNVISLRYMESVGDSTRQIRPTRFNHSSCMILTLLERLERLLAVCRNSLEV